jgi:DNA (cytosine-5)-methyltransferase 1
VTHTSHHGTEVSHRRLDAEHPTRLAAVDQGFTAVDLFAGAGGTTQGLKEAGYRVLAAIENDSAASRTYRANHPEVDVLERDIRRVTAPGLARRVAALDIHVDIMTACPPCQGFSSLGTGRRDDPRNRLVSTIGRFVDQLQPRVVLLENVPGLGSDRRLAELRAQLDERYSVGQYVVDAADFGVPQHRRRMIIMGVRHDLDAAPPVDLRDALPSNFDASRRPAGPVIALAGSIARTSDPTHRARNSSPEVVARIRSVPAAGTRFDLPPEHRLACHNRLAARNATSSYGRIDPDVPAPTMTTRCTTAACGRFIHPTEHRGLSLREAALLQSFPIDYVFEGNYGEVERQIGNAVPPRLARALGLIAGAFLTSNSLAAAA